MANNLKIPNLSKEQAFDRSKNIIVENYQILLDLEKVKNLNENTFNCKTTINFESKVKSTFIDLVAKKINSVKLNNEELRNFEYDSEAGLKLKDLQKQNKLEIDAEFLYSNTGEGLHRFQDPKDKEIYLYTQFETADAKRVFACFDQPNIKSKFTLTVKSPSNWQIISNTPSKKIENNTHYFHETKPLSTYLVAIIAGPYSVWTDEYKSDKINIPLGVFCRKSLSESMDAERIFKETKQGFDFYHKIFDSLYPFEKYDQLFVPEFNAGAMENAGAVTFRDEYIFTSKVTDYRYERRADTIFHEMAHMWFGDLVTMAWWEDLWLNESFASFASILTQTNSSDYQDSWATFAAIDKSWAYTQDQLPTTHPVAANIPDHEAVEVNFDGITYAKGASLLKQLVNYIGFENFISGLKAYFREYAYKNASYEDLLKTLKQYSNYDLEAWSNQWLKTTGVNKFRTEIILDNKKIETLKVIQSGAAPGMNEVRIHKFEVSLFKKNENSLNEYYKKEFIVDKEINVLDKLSKIDEPDFVLLNSDDSAYLIYYFDEKSLEFLKSNFQYFKNPLHRAIIWSNIWEMLKTNSITLDYFINFTLKGLKVENHPGVIELALKNLKYSLNYFINSKNKIELNNKVAKIILSLIPKTNDETIKLSLFNTLCSLDTNTDASKILFNSLKLENFQNIIQLDSQAKWNIIQHLSTINLFNENEIHDLIENELSKDSSAEALLNANIAKGSINSIENKEKIWKEIFSSNQSLSLIRAKIAGFIRTGDAKLLNKFTKQYFENIEKDWETNSNETNQVLATGLYPFWSNDIEFVNSETTKLLENTKSNSKIKIFKENNYKFNEMKNIK